LIVWAYGKETYVEMMQLRKDIRLRREKAVYQQRKKRQKLADAVALVLAMIFASGVIYGTALIIKGA